MQEFAHMGAVNVCFNNPADNHTIWLSTNIFIHVCETHVHTERLFLIAMLSQISFLYVSAKQNCQKILHTECI